MGTIYLCIVIFLLCLAVFDLFVGVSNLPSVLRWLSFAPY